MSDRLDEIKRLYDMAEFAQGGIVMSDGDIRWLITEVERLLSELRGVGEQAGRTWERMLAEAKAMEAVEHKGTIARLREALEQVLEWTEEAPCFLQGIESLIKIAKKALATKEADNGDI